MTTTRFRQLFVNLPVRHLKRSMEFFTRLGFEFDQRFTDEETACMIISNDAYVMLLAEPAFQKYARKPVGDPGRHTTSIFALSAMSRAEVDRAVDTALQIGGAPASPPLDREFMYLRSFYDIDGHHWEVLWMDPSTSAT